MLKDLTDNKLEDEIKELYQDIDLAEDIYPNFMFPELKELRHRVLFVHAMIEDALVLLLGKYALEPAKAELKTTTSQTVMWRIRQIGDAMEFAPKVNLAFDLELIDGKLKNTFFAVNNLRLIFAHPSGHYADMRSFLEKPQKQVDALKVLKNAMEKMNALFSEMKR